MSDLFQFYSILRQSVLFAGCGDEELTTALKVLRASFVSYNKDDFLLNAGQPLCRFGMVVYGCVKVCIDDIEGNTAIMAQVSKGNTFGESLCFLQTPDPEVYIRATEDTGVIWFSVQALFARQNDETVRCLEKRFAGMLAARTLRMNQRIQILSQHTLRQKLITYFTFCLQNTDKNSFHIPMNREELAQFIGTDRSALSRELSRMQKDGLITYHKNDFYFHFHFD